MAGRSPSPSLSCLASAPSMKQSSRRRPRLPRAVSSCSPALSDDSLTATLKSLTTDEAKDVFAVLTHASPRASPSPSGLSVSPSPSGYPPGAASPTRQTYLDETPGRRKSKPIAIQPPRHARTVYTPLSARGDLPGGYFPNHETFPRQYKPHPFKPESTPSSPAMSSASSPVSTPAISTPRIPPSALPVSYSPELMSIPIGKYHPSNYKLVSPSTSTPPTSTSPTSTPPTNVTPPTNLEIPSEGKKSKRPSQERRPSEVRKKVQQYQRDMIAQARRAGLPDSSVQGSAKSTKPISPRLLPLGSPGPITPLELEESAGYLVAGARGEGLVGRGSEREREMVGRMIRSEQERDLTQGTQSSTVKV